MFDCWALVWSQIGSVFLWCCTVAILFGVIFEIRWWTPGTLGLISMLSVIGGICGGAAWWLWP